MTYDSFVSIHARLIRIHHDDAEGRQTFPIFLNTFFSLFFHIIENLSKGATARNGQNAKSSRTTKAEEGRVSHWEHNQNFLRASKEDVYGSLDGYVPETMTKRENDSVR